MAAVIIDVDISPANAPQKANDLATAIQKVKDQQTILIATGQKQTQEYANNTAALKKLTQEQKAYNNIAKSATGSNNQLRAQLVLLTNQYNALSKSERENTTAGKALQAQTRAISDELKANEKAVGDNRRNVGNYRDALAGVIGQQVPFIGQVQQMGKGFTALGGIIKTTNGTLGLLKIALISTGIGAIIVLLGSLIAYFKSTEKGSEQLERGIAGLKGAFMAFIQPLAKVGEFLMDLFTNPIKALKDFKTLLSGNLLTGIKNFGKSVKDGFTAGAEIEGLKQQAEDAGRELNRQASKLRADGAVLRAKGDAESLKKAAEYYKKADQLSQQATQNEVKAQQAYIKDLEKRGQARDSDYDKLNELYAKQDQSRQTDAAKSEKINTRLEKLNAKKEAARIKEAEENEKANQAKIESENVTNNFLVDARQAEINNINLDINKKTEIYKKYGKTTEALEKERSARLLALSAQYAKEDKKQLESYITEQENLFIQSIRSEEDRKFASAELQRTRNLRSIDKEIAETEDRIKKGDARATAILLEQLNTRDAIVKQNSLDRGLALQEQYDIDLAMFNQHQVDLAEAKLITAGSEAEQLIARQTLLEAMYQQDIDMAIKTGADTTLINAQYEAEKKAINEQTVASAFEAFKSFSTNFQKLVGENTLAYKIAGEVQARVDAAQSLRNNILIIQENVKALAAQGKLPFPANLIAIFSTLAALASAASSAKTIFSMPKGFADGGQFISDGKGSVLPGYSKHDNINARLRSGEGVVVSEAMKDPAARNAIAAINVAYGGRDFSVPNFTGAFATGGIAQGGYVTTLSDSVNQSNDISNAIVRGLLQAPPAIVDVRQIITESQKAYAVQVKQNI